MSKSPACQQNPARARAINVNATALLARLAERAGFIFLSTDLVFDGRRGWYREEDAINPLSVYAQTKAEAEALVLANPGHTVVRTSLNGGISPTGDRGFNEELLRVWKSGKDATLFTDEFRCPIAARVTARALWEIAEKKLAGLYHLAGRERLSRWEIGRLIAGRHPELNPRIAQGSLHDFKGAPRSPDTSLNCARLQAHLSVTLEGLREWLNANPGDQF